MVRLQVEALVALHRVAGAVALREAEAGEALDLPPHLFGLARRIAHALAVAEELPLHHLELRPVAVADVHAAPHDVRLFQVQPAVEMHHLDHVLLVHHHAVSLGHNLQQALRGQLSPLGVVVAQQVLAHHAALRHAGAYDAARRHQPKVVLHLQLLQQHAHGRALHVEAADGVARAQQLLDRGILLEARDVVDVDRGAECRMINMECRM